METKEQKVTKTGWARLLQLAATKKALIVFSVLLSALASIASFVPYIAIYFIIQEILSVYPDYFLLQTDTVLGYGWLF